jgi:hypothetical protein
MLFDQSGQRSAHKCAYTTVVRRTNSYLSSEENTSARGVPRVAKHHVLHVLKTHMLQTNRKLSKLSETSEVLGFQYEVQG